MIFLIHFGRDGRVTFEETLVKAKLREKEMCGRKRFNSKFVNVSR